MTTNALYEKPPQEWHCLGCGRSRSQIQRIGSSGDHVAKVVEHHDHIKDYTNASMREKFGADWISKVPPGIGEHLNRIERFVIGFSPTVICEDCNNAEAKAKQLAGAQKFFSFAPSEIRRFISSSPNQKHVVDPHRVAQVCSDSKGRYALRIAVAERLYAEALSGSFWTTLR